jgi:hypothetical protein
MRKARPNPYVFGGALRSTDENAYIVRPAEIAVIKLLQTGRFAQLAEPRQQGKTSLINRLKSVLSGMSVIEVTASDYDPATPEDWYALIGDAIYRQARLKKGLLPRGSTLRAPEHRNNWADFLSQLSDEAAHKVVVALDEVDLIGFPNSDHFYSVIKNVRDRQHNLSFLLSGCFHPNDLVKNLAVSPFNAANRVRLPDFSAAEVLELATRGPWPRHRDSKLAGEVFKWTDGHPYITEFIFYRVAEEGTRYDVESAVEEFVLEDSVNLPRILAELSSETNNRLRAALDRILEGERVGISESQPNAATTRLRLLGAIKPMAGQICKVRNRIYEQVFRRQQRRHDVFISYRREDDIWADRLKLELESFGLRCFLDRTAIKPGRQYPPALFNAIETSTCVVLLLNRDSLLACKDPRDWIRVEVEHADKSNVQVIPVLIRDSPRPDANGLPASMKSIAKAHSIRIDVATFMNAVKLIQEAVERPGSAHK